MSRILLGVNVDHIATIRQARLTRFPDPVFAALLAEQAGADGITMHLREDRRHIQNDDLIRARDTITTRLNLEMAATDEMVKIATRIKPTYVCLVPEKREELTTEGGLDLFTNSARIRDVIAELDQSGIKVSLFSDPEIKVLDQAITLGAPIVELHTGEYVEDRQKINRFEQAIEYGLTLGLQINAGHGLNYHNTYDIAALGGITELNIGHAIVSQALFSGWYQAVRDMRNIIDKAVADQTTKTTIG